MIKDAKQLPQVLRPWLMLWLIRTILKAYGVCGLISNIRVKYQGGLNWILWIEIRVNFEGGLNSNSGKYCRNTVVAFKKKKLIRSTSNFFKPHHFFNLLYKCFSGNSKYTTYVLVWWSLLFVFFFLLLLFFFIYNKRIIVWKNVCFAWILRKFFLQPLMLIWFLNQHFA